MANAIFANGLIVKKAHPNAPSFVKCSLSFKVDEFIQCLQQNNKNGWVNVDIKLAQDNVKLYAQIDDWQPTQQQAPQQPQYQQPQQQQNSQFTPDNNLAPPMEDTTDYSKEANPFGQ